MAETAQIIRRTRESSWSARHSKDGSLAESWSLSPTCLGSSHCWVPSPYTSDFYDLESFLPAQVKREEARKQREALKNDEPNVGKLTFGSYQRWLLKKGPDAFD